MFTNGSIAKTRIVSSYTYDYDDATFRTPYIFVKNMTSGHIRISNFKLEMGAPFTSYHSTNLVKEIEEYRFDTRENAKAASSNYGGYYAWKDLATPVSAKKGEKLRLKVSMYGDNITLCEGKGFSLGIFLNGSALYFAPSKRDDGTWYLGKNTYIKTFTVPYDVQYGRVTFVAYGIDQGYLVIKNVRLERIE